MIERIARRLARRTLPVLAQDQAQDQPAQDGEAAGQFGGKGPFNLPADHVAATHSPVGFSCATCKFVDAENHACTEPNYIAWNGGDGALPDFPLEQICSDWWTTAA